MESSPQKTKSSPKDAFDPAPRVGFQWHIGPAVERATSGSCYKFRFVLKCRLVGWNLGCGCRNRSWASSEAYCGCVLRRRFLKLSSAQRGWLAGPYFVFEILAAFAAVGDESPTFQSSPDTKLLSLRSCRPRSPNARGRGLRRVAVEKNRSRSLGSDGKRFARDYTAKILITLSHPRRKNWGAPRMGQPLFVRWGGVFLLSSAQRGWLAGPYFIFGIFAALRSRG